MILQQDSYTAELDTATQRIKRLKDNYARRRRLCGTGGRDVGQVDVKDESKDSATGSAEEAEPSKDISALKVLVAKCLLDPALTIPAEAAQLHTRVGLHFGLLLLAICFLQCPPPCLGRAAAFA